MSTQNEKIVNSAFDEINKITLKYKKDQNAIHQYAHEYLNSLDVESLESVLDDVQSTAENTENYELLAKVELIREFHNVRIHD